MKELDEFLPLLEEENKPEAIRYAMNLLESGKMDVRTLYEQVISPSLYQMQCQLGDKDYCIWKEHVRKGILRTIVECSYPYVLKERESKSPAERGKAIVLCPPEEYDDLDARITSDFFNLLGWNSVFVGSDTPFRDFYNAASRIGPQIIAIIVTNYYTLVVSKKIITQLKALLGDSVKIVVGGYAVRPDSGNFASLGADEFIGSFEDLLKVTERAGEKK